MVNRAAFTLIELLAVIAIITLVAGLIIGITGRAACIDRLATGGRVGQGRGHLAAPGGGIGRAVGLRRTDPHLGAQAAEAGTRRRLE